MRPGVLQSFVAAMGAVVLLIGGSPEQVTADSHGVTVTNAGDAGASGGAICPHAALCTLRRAIEVANADVVAGTFTITFSSALFPSEAPGTLPVGSTPLPNITRANVAIDGAGAGVELTGVSPSLTSIINGLTATGDGFQLRNLRIHGFTGSCVAATGAGAKIGAPGAGNVLGGCATGVAVAGAGSTVAANRIGFTPTGVADQVSTGIVVSAGGVTVGGPATTPGAGNTIGFTGAAIFVGSGTSSAFTGVTIERNTIGRRPLGDPAPVGVGVILSQPSNTTAVLANDIANARTGIQVRPDAGNVSVTRNRFVGNVFDAISALAIDLGADGIRNPNDAGDTDTGPNTLRNHPIIGRATQTLVTGTACAGCQVQVYLAAHLPGGAGDYGRIPLPGGTVTATAAGDFALENPAASAGDWLVAIATDSDGNSSEFGPPARVGSGAVLCGNVHLDTGWNHVGYFGSQPVSLFSTFPSDAQGVITAVYRAVDGSGGWERWFRDTLLGRTLATVEPGESYWIFASAPTTLPGGFSISFPVPAQFVAGPNDFTYLGASAHALDALASLNGAFRDLYRFDAATASWLRFGDPSVPAWAQDFTSIEACQTYQVWLDAPATLVPLQP